MRRIERDPRHANITFIRNDERPRRECPQWAMHPVITPLTGLGSTSLFSGKIPREMELDTQVIFTSFASSLTAAQAAHHAERERILREAERSASND